MDLEERAHSEHADALRLWLRMLTCTQLMEKQLRGKLRDAFNTTLPRFDLLAQLERAPGGLKMRELSQRMMVTGGSITGITDQLVAEGMVERSTPDCDRRAYLVRLTPAGRTNFAAMARDHEEWVVQAFAQLGSYDIAALHGLLGRVKGSLQAQPVDP